MIIRLQHQRSDGEKDIYHLKSGRRYHIGRGSACEVRILDLKLSRKHCAVEYSEGEWRMIDLASTNGCKVDGDQIVGSVPLKVGSTVDIGQSSLQVVRILGDDEVDEEALGSTLATISPMPAKASAPAPSAPSAAAPAPARPGPRERPIAPMKTPAPVEQEGMDGEPARAPALEHVESEWEPEPEPESLTKTGALVPAAKAGASDQGLAAARAAANAAAEQMSDNTGQIQRPGSRLSDKPPTAELESGGYRSLDQVDLADDSAVARKMPGAGAPAAPPPPPPTPSQLAAASPQPPGGALAPPPPRPQTGVTKQPGTETRKRQKMVPVIVQALDADGAPAAPLATEAAPAAADAIPLGSAPPMEAAPPIVDAAAATPAAEAKPAVAPGAAEAERTFFITVLGRRVGPLTRAVARDLKAREIKGTLTFKDLERYS